MRALLPPLDDDLDDVALDRLYAVPPGQHLRANFATSLDGAIALNGVSAGIGGQGDKRIFSLLRSLADVVLVGAGTARAEDYGPARVRPDRQDRRRAAGMRPVPPIAVVTNSAKLDPSARLFATGSGPRALVLTCAAADPSAWRELTDVAEVVLCGTQEVELDRMLRELADRGMRRVLCEGGPKLVNDLLSHDLLDELCLTAGPLLAGPGLPGLSQGAAFDVPVALRLQHVLESDGALISRYSITHHTVTGASLSGKPGQS